MKCAKCGHEIDPSSPNCPYCAVRKQQKKTDNIRCPHCGSDHIEDEPSPWWQAGGPGCMLSILGLLLWLWLHTFGLTPHDYICLDCGCRWGKPSHTWLGLLVLALGVALLIAISIIFLPLLLSAATTTLLAAFGIVVGLMLFRMLKH